MKKRLAITASAFVLICTLGVFGCSSSQKSSSETPTQATVSVDSGSAAEDKATAEPAEQDTSNEKYAVTIDKLTVEKDYDGNNAAVVTFTFTNNSDDTTSFLVATVDKAFQNGVQLDSAFVSGLSSNASNDVKPGATITVQKAYELDDMSDVTIEVSEFLSFSSDLIAEKTFSLTS